MLRRRTHRQSQAGATANGDRHPRAEAEDEQAAPGHEIYPYLIHDLVINRPNQVWAANITYIPIGHGFLYLVAIIDWASRAVLAWRLSNTMDATFCIDAFDEALARFGKPEIFNTDQGSQFTASYAGFWVTKSIRQPCEPAFR